MHWDCYGLRYVIGYFHWIRYFVGHFYWYWNVFVYLFTKQTINSKKSQMKSTTYFNWIRFIDVNGVRFGYRYWIRLVDFNGHGYFDRHWDLLNDFHRYRDWMRNIDLFVESDVGDFTFTSSDASSDPASDPASDSASVTTSKTASVTARDSFGESSVTWKI